jgi:hypothetical protein
MFGIDLKRSVVTLAAMAGLLALAGPAGAQVGATGLKYETEVTDYARLSTASDGLRDPRSQTHQLVRLP